MVRAGRACQRQLLLGLLSLHVYTATFRVAAIHVYKIGLPAFHDTKIMLIGLLPRITLYRELVPNVIFIWAARTFGLKAFIWKCSYNNLQSFQEKF